MFASKTNLVDRMVGVVGGSPTKINKKRKKWKLKNEEIFMNYDKKRGLGLSEILEIFNFLYITNLNEIIKISIFLNSK